MSDMIYYCTDPRQHEIYLFLQDKNVDVIYVSVFQ